MFQIELKLQNPPAGTSLDLDLLSLHESRSNFGSKLFIFCFLQTLNNVYITIILPVCIMCKMMHECHCLERSIMFKEKA